MKSAFTTVAALLLITPSFSQDVITKKSGAEIEARILKIGPSEIEYKRFDNPDGPIFTMLKSDIATIRYENGTEDDFQEEEKQPVNTFSGDLFVKGQTDATLHYRSYGAAGTGTLITGLLSPLVGLIPAIACSSTPPRDHNLDYPDADLIKRHEYYEGYTLRARKIKRGKVWKNWGIALGINVFAVLILSSGQ